MLEVLELALCIFLGLRAISDMVADPHKSSASRIATVDPVLAFAFELKNFESQSV